MGLFQERMGHARETEERILNATDKVVLDWIARGNDERFEIAFNQMDWETCGAHVYEPFYLPDKWRLMEAVKKVTSF